MTARRENSGCGEGKPTSRAAPGEDRHAWEFKARFRRHAFGWRSQPAITRIRQAVAEIKKVVRKDPMLAAEGAIAFLERVSPAIEHVDGSSGSMGTAVNHTIVELVPIIAGAPADAQTSDARLERLAAAERLGNAEDVKARIRAMVAAEGAGARFVTQVLGKEIGL
jgi:broad specificity phosphatase PhoE